MRVMELIRSLVNYNPGSEIIIEEYDRELEKSGRTYRIAGIRREMTTPNIVRIQIRPKEDS